MATCGTGGVGTGFRTFDYSQIPSALIAGIDVYKTSAANQIDGGLGGLVSQAGTLPRHRRGLGPHMVDRRATRTATPSARRSPATAHGATFSAPVGGPL